MSTSYVAGFDALCSLSPLQMAFVASWRFAPLTWSTIMLGHLGLFGERRRCIRRCALLHDRVDVVRQAPVCHGDAWHGKDTLAKAVTTGSLTQ